MPILGIPHVAPNNSRITMGREFVAVWHPGEEITRPLSSRGGSDPTPGIRILLTIWDPDLLVNDPDLKEDLDPI